MLLTVVGIFIILRRKFLQSIDGQTNLVDSLWKEFAESHSLETELSNRWLGLIKERYLEPQRAYHTLNHIEHMLDLFLEFKHRLKNPDAVFLAIIFHDVIYDPQAVSGSGEEESAEEFERFYLEAIQCDECTLEQTVNNTLISRYILETKTHSVSEYLAMDTDLLFFLDFDMAILGVCEGWYMKYADQIRIEYQHMLLEDYSRGRREVMKGFLAYPAIYNTDQFKMAYETRARDNITREISHLTQVYETAKKENENPHTYLV